MKRSRHAAYEERTGQRRANDPQRAATLSGDSAAAAYELLLPTLARLRSRLTADGRASRPITEVRRDHADLDHALAAAVATAFAADAGGAAVPAGAGSWAATGLACSRERELALLAAADVCGVLDVTVARSPRWAANTTDRRSTDG